MREITIKLPRPHKAQKQIKREARRFNVLNCGRRFGKTSLGIDLCSVALEGYPVGWFTPIYKDVLEVWREVLQVYAPVTSRVSSQEKRIELITGGVIEFWSLDNQDAGRGRKYKRVIFDEAAKVPNLLNAWNLSIYPTLLDYKGDAFFLSTPRGLNDFYKLYQNGLDTTKPDWQCWKFSTYDNPHIDPAEVDLLKSGLSERAYSQEIMAEFIADGTGVFRNVQNAAIATPQSEAIRGHDYIISVDTARVDDFNVITVIDTTLKEVVCLDRFNMVDTMIQVNRIVGMWERFGRCPLVIEQNSAHAILDLLQQLGIYAIGFQTTNASKTAAIQALERAFDYNEIKILNDPVLIGELMSFDSEKLPSGLIRYSAPAGMHDDCVMSLAIGWHHSTQFAPLWIS